MRNDDRVEELSWLLKTGLEEWRSRTKNPKYRPKPLVTVTREPGSGGDAIAQKLCSDLGMRLYDWKVVEKIAEDARVSTELVSWLEKKPRSEFADFAGDLLSEFRKEYYFSSEEYLDSLKRVLLAIALPGNAVIVGRGGNFFLPQDARIGLCFVAPLSVRIKNVMKEFGVTENTARKHISRIESVHPKLAKRYFRADIRDPCRYHLVINTALVKPDTIVKLVKSMIEAKKGEER